MTPPNETISAKGFGKINMVIILKMVYLFLKNEKNYTEDMKEGFDMSSITTIFDKIKSKITKSSLDFVDTKKENKLATICARAENLVLDKAWDVCNFPWECKNISITMFKAIIKETAMDINNDQKV
jgi:hypothetical protein